MDTTRLSVAFKSHDLDQTFHSHSRTYALNLCPQVFSTDNGGPICKWGGVGWYSALWFNVNTKR